MDKYLDSFREMISLRGLTDHTLKNYCTYIRAYLDYLTNILHKLPEDVSWDELRDYISGKNYFAAEKPYKVTIDGTTTLLAHTIIIATGASAKYLGLEDEAKYAGSGVSACATCDGFFYRKKVVAVVGGGDTACEEAMYLSSLCKHVYLIVRRDVLRASQVMQDRVKNKENITILYKHQTVGLTGDGVVEGANLVKNKGEENEEQVHIDIDGFFLAIGHQPNSKIFKPYIDMDEVGYIKTQGSSPKTNIEGIFAAGDVADPTYRQAITSAGSGCKAAIEAERYLMTIACH